MSFPCPLAGPLLLLHHLLPRLIDKLDVFLVRGGETLVLLVARWESGSRLMVLLTVEAVENYLRCREVRRTPGRLLVFEVVYLVVKLLSWPCPSLGDQFAGTSCNCVHHAQEKSPEKVGVPHFKASPEGAATGGEGT